MAINPILFELAKQFGGSLVDEEDTTEKDRIATLANRFGGEPVEGEEPVSEEEPQRASPVVGGTGVLGLLSAPFGREAVKETLVAPFQPSTYESFLPVMGETFDITKAKFGLASVDALPDSIDVAPPGVPMEDIDRAGGVRQYYETFYGVKSDEELRELKNKTIDAIASRIKESKETISELTPEGLTPAQLGVRGGLQSTVEMLPGIAGSIATGSPVPALVTAAGLTGLESYGEARLAGKDPSVALAYGGIDAAIEVATERIGLKPLLKILKKSDIADVSTKEELKDALTSFAKREIGSEQAATALQTLNALAFGLDEELANAKSPEEAIRIQGERQFITAVATMVGGGAQAGAVTAVNKIRENNLRKEIERTVRDMEGVGSLEERKAIRKLRDQALDSAQTISSPDVTELSLEEGQTEPTPLQFGDAYANRIFNSVGQYIPADVKFTVNEKQVDGETQYVVTDQEGRQYGQNLKNKDQADSLALSLNNIGSSRAALLESLNPLYNSLNAALKGYGLNDIGLTLSDRIFTKRGEALTSEGLFDPVVREVFLAVDAIDPAGNLDFDQRRQALRGVLRHEVVHALRYLDLWKKSEWKNLENAVSRIKKKGTDKTYLDIAKENYGDETSVIQVEEAVAELIRDVADRRANVAGKPRSLSERAIQFFDRAKNALTGSGFQTYEDIVNRFESGEIGARQRGKIRTFRASEEQAAKQGLVPERLQRVLKSPEGRNQFREDTVQNLLASLPQQVIASPARNSIRNVGILDSRSAIEDVPDKITVDDQEFPTRDSEGRLIYSGYEGPEVFGIETRSTQEGLQNFWRSFKGSKAVDKQGRPQLYLHGTAGDITEFRPKQAGAVFVTRDIPFAESFGDLSNTHMITNFPDFMGEQEVLDVLNESMRSATTPQFYDRLEKIQKRVSDRISQGKGLDAKSIADIKDLYTGKKVLGKTDIAYGVSSNMIESIEKRLPSNANLVPVYVNAQNPFDYENSEDVKRVIKRVKEISPVELDSGDIEGLKKGDWITIEGLGEASPILDAIKDLGYDSMYIEESGIKNLAVFSPNQIKSAIGNNGDFSPIVPSIRESRKEPTYKIINSRTGEVVGQANTINGARRSVDRRDNQYGASVHTIQVVDEEADRAQRERSRARLGLPPLTPDIRESRVRNPQLDTPDFQRFFKDSKVVDENGEPLIVYHGTDREIDTFKASRDGGSLGTGIYFSPSAEFAGQYAQREGGNVVPAYLSLKNPLVIDGSLSVDPMIEALMRLGVPENKAVNIVEKAYENKGYITTEVKNRAQKEGFDGILQYKNGQLGEVVAFSPNQVKSAVGNIGTFDITRPSIRESRRREATPIESALEIARRDFADYSQRSEEEFFGKFWPTLLSSVRGTVAPTNTGIRTAAKRAIRDMSVWLRDNPKFRDYYNNDMAATRQVLESAYGPLTDDEFLYYRIANGLTSPATKLPSNVGDAVTVFNLWKKDGNLDAVKMGVSEKGNLVIEESPISISGTTGNNKARTLKIIDRLIQEKGGVTNAVNFLMEGVPVKELNAFNREMGYKGQVADVNINGQGAIQDLVEMATGQRELIPRMFIFGKKVGAYTLNMAGDSRYNTIDVWESRFIRSYFDGLFAKRTGLPEVAEEDKLFQDFTKIFKEEFEKETNQQWDNSALQAMRWFYIINAAKQAGYTGASTNETISEYTRRSIQSPRKSRTYRRRKGDGEIAEAVRPTETEIRAERGEGEARPDEAIVPAARESRKRPDGTPEGSTRIGPSVPGPSTNVENTADAEALNGNRPVNSMGIPSGPQVTTTDPETLEADTSEVRLRKQGTSRLVRTLEFIESAPDRLRRGIGLEQLAKNVEDYYDTVAERMGFANNIIRNALAKIPLKDRYSFESNIPGFGPVLIQGKALREFELFIRARENGRKDEAQFIRNQMSDSGRALVEAWEQIATEAGRVNLEVRTPYGKPLRVYDPNLVTGDYGEKLGGWRQIKAAPNFFPRTLRKEVLAVMNNPDSDPALFNQLMRALVEAGKADDIDAARKWLLRSYFSEEIRSDYFAGVERARSEKLPEIFYDYSWDAVTRYINKWAKRTSQVQYFGQEIGQMPNQRDYFGRVLARTDIDEDTKAYIASIRDRIYEVDHTGDYGFILNWLNSIATGSMLGNPISSSLNLIGGTALNIAEFGLARVGKAFAEYAKTPVKPIRSFVNELNANEFGIDAIAKAWKELKVEWAKVQEEGTTLGILNNDVINLLNDIPSEANKYFEDERTFTVGPISLKTAPVSRGLAKSANVLLTLGGYQKAENIVRYTALLAAKGWLNDSLKAINSDPRSKAARRFVEWVKRENLDLEKLILENGIGKETGRFFRRAVNVPQGSYKIDMTPVFVDTPVGRFLFKYQKFATQVNRYFYRHFLKPFKDKPDATNLFRILAFLGSSIVGGELVLLIREAFGYGDPSADVEEITKALENEELARALALSFSRVQQDILAIGVLGFFGNYAQLLNDWQDQMRVKNPLSPPGAASIGNLADLINKLLGQKTITASDLDDYAQAQISLYRAGRRITLATLDSLGSDSDAVEKFVTQKNLREVREFTDRYSEEMDIEYKRRIAPGAVIPTPQTPFNRRIVDALYRGNSAEARMILLEAQAGKTYEERERVRRSAMSAVRNGQPIRIAGSGASDEDRKEFMKWAERNLSEKGYLMTYQMDFTYRNAARRADLGFNN